MAITKNKLDADIIDVKALNVTDGTLIPDRRVVDIAPGGTRLFAVRTGGGGVDVSISEFNNCLVSISGAGERLAFSDEGYIVFGTSGGTIVGQADGIGGGFRIGTLPTNKIAEYDGVPQMQCPAIADAVDLPTALVAINSLLAYLRLKGTVAT